MKKSNIFFAAFFVLMLLPITLYSHEKVVFVHGINSNGTMWSGGYNMIYRLKSAGWNMYAYNPSRNYQVNFWAQSQELQNSIFSQDHVALTHSMGAPAARTLIKRFGNDKKIYKLVSLAGANQPAEIAVSVYDGTMAWFIQNQSYALLGPWVQELIDLGGFDLGLLNALSFAYYGALQVALMHYVSNDAMNDLAGNGYSYIQNENDNVPKATIFARELDLSYEFYKTGATYFGYYPSTGKNVQRFIMSTYRYTAYYCWLLGDYYGTIFFPDGTYNYDYDPIASADWYYRGDGLYWSYQQIKNSAFYWRIVNGGNLYYNGQFHWTYTDGILPLYSQWNPNVLDAPIVVQGSTNHSLVYQSNSGRDAISSGFGRVSFNNSPIPPPPTTMSVNIVPFPQNGPNSWIAEITNGTGSFEYAWYYWDPYLSPGGGTGGSGTEGGEEPYGRIYADGPVVGGNGWISHGSGNMVQFVGGRSGYKLKIVVRDRNSGAIAEKTLSW